ncbi:MAG: single-stranded DNA-binding protein [Eubacteriales bacterium]|nr:single-stranded DNA-binding protein [Eubacteriales bacterium]
MVGNVIDNNAVTIAGIVDSLPVFSHEVYGEGFYNFSVNVTRLSDSFDKIPVLISERLVEKERLKIGTIIELEGQFRSYNNYTGEDGSRLILIVFVRELRFLEDKSEIKNPNQIYLNGYICKKPVYRTTPFGREITDLLLAVNRPYNKSDYIPCIAWGRNARFSENLAVGDNVKIWGRIQSRKYQKKYSENKVITKVAYEVSVSKMETGIENNSSEDECASLEKKCEANTEQFE